MALTLTLFAACALPPSAPLLPPSFSPEQNSFTDDELRAAAYSAAYRWPAGFDREAIEGYQYAYYMNTLSIRPSCCRPPESRELDTEDVQQARAWAESTHAYSEGTAPPDLVKPRITERYIEFPPLPVDFVTRVPLRVHRTSYLDRTGHDRFNPDSLRGTFNARPLDPSTVRPLGDYLWTIDLHSSEKVLSSFARDEPELVTHTIFDLVIHRGDYGMCDELTLRRLEYRVSKSTGVVVLRVSNVRKVEGRCHRRGACGS